MTLSRMITLTLSLAMLAALATGCLVRTRLVPDTVGLEQSAAEANLLAACFAVGVVETTYSDTVPVGHVISQDPVGGVRTAAGTLVDLLVSLGPEPIAVPDVVGLERTAAEDALTAQGLSVGVVTHAYSNDVDEGAVVAQDPAAQTLLFAGDAVDLVISKGSGGIAISTIEELQLIGNDPAYPLDARYYLANDIDASATAEWNDWQGFIPIGAGGSPETGFSGTLDGDGRVISNLAIVAPGPGGLFAAISSTGTIMNLGLEAVDVFVFEGAGALAGWNAGTITDCYVTGKVDGWIAVGGLLGYHEGNSVVRCHSAAAVSGLEATGGLVGFVFDGGVIANSSASGDVSSDFAVGGLIGFSEGGVVTKCYATGSVTAGSGYAGGLVGGNAGTLEDSYATGSVTGEEAIGGLAGMNAHTIANCYAVGPVTGDAAVGGLVGVVESEYFEMDEAMVTASFFDVETSGQALSAGGEGMTTAEMMSAGTFTGAGWDFDAVWSIEEGLGYPFLR